MPDNQLPGYPFYNQKETWDCRYRIKGRQWGNAPDDFSDSPDTGVILELGVGDGKNLRTRSTSEAYYIGLDFSREALCLCLNDPLLTGIRFLLADACYIPIHDNFVNKVYAHHIMGHLSSIVTPLFLSEIFRVLCPNGQVVLTVFAEGDMRDKKGKEVEFSTYLRGDGIITRYYSEKKIRALGKKFLIRKISRIEWPLRIRGKKYTRAIITALFEKPSDSIDSI